MVYNRAVHNRSTTMFPNPLGRNGPPRSYRCALVTGATSGIGAAFAHALPPATGLVLTGRNEEALAAAARDLGREDRRVETVAADLTVPADRATLIARAREAEIDLLVNNAGAGNFGAVLDQTVEAERQVVELNVVAVAELTRALLPGMILRAKRDGTRAGLIIVSSSTAFTPVPYLTTYSASKAFDLFYAEGLAEELRGEPVDVLAVCPGPVRTKFGERAGFSPGSLPGAIDPDTVAREALDALGRRTVLVTGRANRLAFDPLLVPHRVATGGIGRVMRFADRWFRRE